MNIGVIADDMSGSLDTGAQFANLGLRTKLRLARDIHDRSQVEVINTGSREKDEASAAASVQRAVESLNGRLLYKKIDSTLRGHISTEIKTILRETGYHKAVICPAIIQEGRRVEGGKLWIGNRLLHETDFASDPTWPAKTSDIQERLGSPIAQVSLSVVRSGESKLRHHFQEVESNFLVPDVVTDSDLADIAQAALATDILPCGAFGFAYAWAAALTGRTQQRPDRLGLRLDKPILFVAGSRHPITREQIRWLVRSRSIRMAEIHSGGSSDFQAILVTLENEIAEGRSILLCSPEKEIHVNIALREIMDGLAELTRHITGTTHIGGLVVCGGETLQSILRALETQAVEIQGEFRSGFPFGRLVGGLGCGLPIFTKAGGFGVREALEQLYEHLLLDE